MGGYNDVAKIDLNPPQFRGVSKRNDQKAFPQPANRKFKSSKEND